MVKKQKYIDFQNDCGAIVNYEELRNALCWYSEKPQLSTKHIFMHGKYPAVSVCGEKVHVHRLLMMYWLDSKIPREYSVHHMNGNRMDARKENLIVILNSAHNRAHNSGRKPTESARQKLIEFNHSRKGTRQPNKRKDISVDRVCELMKAGYSINKISIELGCDWSTVKARQQDIHDNPELLEGGGEK